MNTHTRSHLKATWLALALLTAALSKTVHAKDLFNNDPAGKHTQPAQQLISPPAEEEADSETALSATDAAQRAQSHADGQVMNVRKYQSDNRTLYGVKLLQKNGRMKTINVDANSGDILEP